MKKLDITEQRFGRLVGIFLYKIENKRTFWLCKCDCGNNSIVLLNNLTKGNTTSCGCYLKEIRPTNTVSHNLSKSVEYKTWSKMKGRCLNPKDNRYKFYGGRGITICERWLKFENFYEDMGLKPSKKHSIDRIDNNGNYEPNNCRWTTKLIQASNTRTNVKVINTETNEIYLSIADASRAINLPQYTLGRYLRGKSPNKTKLILYEQTDKN